MLLYMELSNSPAKETRAKKIYASIIYATLSEEKTHLHRGGISLAPPPKKKPPQGVNYYSKKKR